MEDSAAIPKIVHYCWFGRGQKPKIVRKCIASWKKRLPDYTFMEWTEDQFDVHSSAYVQEAYTSRKFAFVSDVARLHALYSHGGIYMDTDVEVLQPLDRFLSHEAFSGFEDEVFLQSGTMGAVPGHPWIKELLDYYGNKSFIKADGSYDTTTNTMVISRICERHGLQMNGRYQQLSNGVAFYPRTYFSPYDYINGGNYLSEESYTIHHFAQSWLPFRVRLRGKLKKAASRVIGNDNMMKIRKMLS